MAGSGREEGFCDLGLGNYPVVAFEVTEQLDSSENQHSTLTSKTPTESKPPF
jgi:hypothetical protein